MRLNNVHFTSHVPGYDNQPTSPRENAMNFFARRKPNPRRRLSQRRLLVERLEERRVLAMITWTGAGDGSSWADAANWDLARLPAAGDDASIPDVAPTSVVLFDSTASDISLSSLTSAEAFQISTRTLTLDQASSFTDDLTMLSGTLDGTGAVTVDGQFQWSSGTLTGSGTLTVNGGTISSSSTKQLGRTINNTGTIDYTGTNLRFGVAAAAGVINNQTNSVFNVTANGDFDDNFDAAHQFNNAGTFNNSGTSTTEFLGVEFNNSHVVDVQSGTVRAFAGGTGTAGTYHRQRRLAHNVRLHAHVRNSDRRR